jgi:hypothetical protein
MGALKMTLITIPLIFLLFICTIFVIISILLLIKSKRHDWHQCVKMSYEDEVQLIDKFKSIVDVDSCGFPKFSYTVVVEYRNHLYNIDGKDNYLIACRHTSDNKFLANIKCKKYNNGNTDFKVLSLSNANFKNQ